MSDRSTQIADFLRGTPWESWTQTALAADASTRQYFRLTDSKTNVILMDADPDKGQQTEPFVQIAQWLAGNGLSPPQILKAENHRGFLLLDDLGADDFSRWMARHPQDTQALYTAATDVLIHLDGVPPPDLPVMTAQTAGHMLDVTGEWYADADVSDLIAAMSLHIGDLCGPADRVALRDFHVENLIWRPERQGLDRIGLLDFQDAFVAPRGYDLVSLLRDVRRDVVPAIAARATAHFIKQTGDDPVQANAAFACIAAQRNLRILGVFARLAKRDGKRRYLQWVPRVWSLIQQDIRHPDLGALKAVVEATLPPPERSAIRDIL